MLRYEVSVSEGGAVTFNKFPTLQEAEKFVGQRYPAYTPDYAGVRPPVIKYYTNDMDGSDDTVITIRGLKPLPSSGGRKRTVTGPYKIRGDRRIKK